MKARNTFKTDFTRYEDTCRTTENGAVSENLSTPADRAKRELLRLKYESAKEPQPSEPDMLEAALAFGMLIITIIIMASLLLIMAYPTESTEKQAININSTK